MIKVLLIDNDQDTLNSFSRTLSAMGFEVIAKPDAKAALSLLRQGALADLVITESSLPEMDGFEFVILMKRILPLVPVIMLTNSGGVESYLKAMSIGIYEYVSKTVTFRDLDRIVHAAIASAETAPMVWHVPARSENVTKGQPSRAAGMHKHCPFL